MPVKTRILDWYFSRRRREIEYFMHYPAEVQRKQLRHLLARAGGTFFGCENGFDRIADGEQFAARVNVCEYDAFEPLVARIRTGESDVLWPGEIRWFAKSSGTTGAKSKFIPVSDEGLQKCHLQGPRDVLALYVHQCPDSDIFSGRTLTLGGSRKLEITGGRALEGDLSAILIENTPRMANHWRAPKTETALIPDFEEKVQAICRETVKRRITAFAGVPSWNLVMMNRVLEYTGKENLLQVWPCMELFIHGGMNFKPYREQYRRMIPSDRMRYMETYNASEGFFAIQDDLARDDMLLMLDYGVYYEFLPVASLNDPSQTVPLEGVRTGVNYAMIITTGNGLWRYMIGDTVEFTTLEPYRIRITGRTRHFINAFGEEIIVDNAETALKAACNATGAHISDYTAGPVYMHGNAKGAHQWLIEFSTPPDDIERFTDQLDLALQQTNSDYEAKRFNDTTLRRPVVTVLPDGTFYRWMKQRGKAGGQNKVPRLSNNRTCVEELLELI